MSATTSAATGRCFGIQRVCQVWERSRSALDARRARAHHRLGAGPARRGPAPRQSDAQLLAAIRTDLARSPFHGEGHRKGIVRLIRLDPKNLQSRTIRLQVDATRPGRRLGLV